MRTTIFYSPFNGGETCSVQESDGMFAYTPTSISLVEAQELVRRGRASGIEFNYGGMFYSQHVQAVCPCRTCADRILAGAPSVEDQLPAYRQAQLAK